jgi:putative hydrolase of the HAD superfamily
VNPSRSRRPLRAVTFDAAGTLIVPAEPVPRTYARFAAGAGLLADPATIGHAFARAMTAAPPLAFGNPAAESLATRERAWWATVVDGALGVPARGPGFEACLDALYAHYARAEAWTVVPAARAVLVTLRRRRLAVGVVSNFDRRLRPLLAALRLAPLLDVTAVSVEVGWAKPAPEVFRHAFRAFGVPAAAVLHVGDDPRADARGALAAGAQAALLGAARVVPGAVPLARLADVPALAARLSRPGRRSRRRAR